MKKLEVVIAGAQVILYVMFVASHNLLLLDLLFSTRQSQKIKICVGFYCHDMQKCPAQIFVLLQFTNFENCRSEMRCFTLISHSDSQQNPIFSNVSA